MFLSRLSETGKKHFLDLCVHASWADGEFAESEISLLSAFCREMGIPENIPDPDQELDELMAKVAPDATDTEKNIMLFELYGLLKIDGSFDDAERRILEKIADGIGAKPGVLDRIISVDRIYSVAVSELYKAVVG